MTRLKHHIVYTFLGVFLFAAATGLSGLIGWSNIESEGLRWLFGLLIAQCVAVIVATIKAPEYFAEPEAILKIKEEHAQVIADMQLKLNESLKDRENMVAWVGTKIMPDDPSHPYYEWIKHRNCQLKENPDSELQALPKSKRF